MDLSIQRCGRTKKLRQIRKTGSHRDPKPVAKKNRMIESFNKTHFLLLSFTFRISQMMCKGFFGIMNLCEFSSDHWNAIVERRNT